MTLDIQQSLQELFERNQEYCLTATAVKNNLSSEIRRVLNLDKKQISQKEIIEKLKPYFTDVFDEFKKRTTKCIGYKISAREMILRQLKRTPDKSSKELKNLLPMNAETYIETINELLAEGMIVCTGIYKNHSVASLKLNDLPSENENENLPSTLDEKTNRFRKAYDVAGGGRPYVYIHKIRDLLKWPAAYFDQVLVELAQQDIIVVQGGNPALLTNREIKDSYYDKYGYLRLTVSWRQ
jgi:hypothetical protein